MNRLAKLPVFARDERRDPPLPIRRLVLVMRRVAAMLPRAALVVVVAVLGACGVSSHGEHEVPADVALSSALAARLGVPRRDGAPVRPGAPLPSPLPATKAVGVGTLRGAFDVNDNGAATYSVPLTIAPGRRGVEPRLSLHYSSDRTSEGLAGVGFALGGMSAITRCPNEKVWLADLVLARFLRVLKR